MAQTRILFAVVTSFCLSACGGGATPPDARTPGVDAAREPDAVVLVAPDAFTGPAADAGPVDAAAPAGSGSIEGNVTRSAMPAAGGRGDLYVAVFASDPVTDRMARNIANARIDDVDMSATPVSVPYTVVGIPTRAEPYFITAFLDDNNTVDPTDPSRAGPDRGDLVALEGFSSIRVTVANDTPVSLNIDLNFNLPF